MAPDVVVLTLLHLLVFVYWLGGDMGAFYASSLLADPKRPVAGRAAAANILTTVDLAPRAGLILAAPTGFALAVAKGWLVGVHVGWVAAAFAASAVWLAAAVLAHLRHGPAGAVWARIDRVVRLGALGAFAVAGAAIVAGVMGAPLFVGLKLLALAAAVALGLAVRVALAPFGPAFAAMVSTGPTPATDATIARTIGRVRPMVMGIWACLLAAAALGLATPT